MLTVRRGVPGPGQRLGAVVGKRPFKQSKRRPRAQTPVRAPVQTPRAGPAPAGGPARSGGRGLGVREARAFIPPRRAVLGLGLVLVGAVCLFLAAAFALTRLEPAWFDPPPGDDPDVAGLADQLQSALVTQATAVRPIRDGASEPWGFSVSERDANAWLAALLPRWLANRDRSSLSAHVRAVQVRFAEGRVEIGARVRSADGEQVVSASVRPAIDGAGALWAPAERVAVGRLPLPMSWAALQARRAAEGMLPADRAADPGAAALINGVLSALDGGRALSVSAAVRLDDGRRVRVLALRPRPGRIEVTCRTEAR